MKEKERDLMLVSLFLFFPGSNYFIHLNAKQDYFFVVDGFDQSIENQL